ncbi:MAG TPA: NAD(P)/FAD-dependent oxidoreductase [Solirubrobacteraceae bacterium]|nr:NAD(P)/FAD-dependent oxidoreductase [Solirubrobacteraceae bacterium]
MGDSREFDVIVVGAGPGGEVCAGRLADADLSVALVEQDLIGGECSFYACMPSKELLRPAQALAEACRVEGAAQAVNGELDVDAVLARRDEIVHGLDDAAQLPWLEERGIALFRGHGELDGERRVRVGEELLSARRAVVLAPGSAAAMPPIDGLREAEPWTNREATTTKAIPRSLLVLGGGVVAVELAQAFTTLGAQVTILEMADRLIGREELFAAEQVREALQAAGVEVVLGVSAKSARRAPAVGAARGAVTLELEDGRSFTGDELLVCTGRKAHTDALGLESVGLQGGGTIDVDERLRVPGRDWLYVVGDANGRVLLTHMGKYQARLVADRILGHPGSLRSDGALSPRVIFTEPQVAAVGYTLASARAAGLSVRAVDQEIEANAGGSFIGHGAPGTARLVIDIERGVIVGATFTGVEVAESLHAATIAVVAEVPLELLAHAVPCFPTRSEVWLSLIEKALHGD